MKSYIILAVVALSLIGLNSAIAQPANGDIVMTVNVAAVPLTVVGGDLTVDGLVQGVSQSVSPDGAGTSLEEATLSGAPITIVTAMTATTLDGDLGASVIVSFALPSRLVPSAGAGYGGVRAAYNGTSACWVDDAAGVTNYFDPRVPARVYLSADAGHVDIYLGGIFTVDVNSTPDAYLGDAIITASYASNAE